MTLHLSNVAAKDGGGTSIAAGVRFNDESGTGAGPFDQVGVIVDSAQAEILGVTTGAAVTTDANGSHQGYLRGLVKLTASLLGSVAAGAAATVSALVGGVYRSAIPTLTNGQQAALGLDAAGGLMIVGSRPFVAASVTVNNGQTTYGTNVNIGGLLAIATGLPAGTVISALVLRLKVLFGNLTTAGDIAALVFNANPTGSTFTDNSQPALNAADLAKLRSATPATSAWTNSGTGTAFTSTYTGVATAPLIAPLRIVVDGSGNIYVALNATTSNVFAATNVLVLDVDGTY